MGVLVSTFGVSWQVVPELYGLTNPDELPLYERASYAGELRALRRDRGIQPVAAIWLITTEGTEDAWCKLQAWRAALPEGRRPDLRRWYPEGVRDLFDERTDRRFADLAHRLVLHARQRPGPVYLSLAGGRKTMSAWLQEAAHRFGGDALLHVVDRFDTGSRDRFRDLQPADLARPLAADLVERVRPLVTVGHLEGGDAYADLTATDYPLPPGGGACPPEEGLVGAVEERTRQAQALLRNSALQVSGDEPGGGFRALYALPVRLVTFLRDARVGADPRREASDLAWLRRLPKAELHCHLGGSLSPAEMVEVALSEEARLAALRRDNPGLAADLDRVKGLAAVEDLDGLSGLLGPGGATGLRGRWPGVPEPLGVCGFLQAFAGREALLHALVYRELVEREPFCAVGIERYEGLGDLQGSGLLQSPATLGAALRVLGRHCREQSVRYLELRCSPLNYTRGGLTGTEVVDTLLDGLDGIGECDLRLIIIGSRHGPPDRLDEHVRLAEERMGGDPRFERRFVGFDLAGAEHASAAATFREAFRPLHEGVVRITVHAGEGTDAKSVWQAVYDLHADRVGHGLTLADHPRLLDRFRDRRIAIEMCPSSNYQIVGYRDHLRQVGPADRDYPLRQYLDAGLHVTVNTDDPGISGTDLSAEYLQAAALTAGGLSRWEVLRVVRNGFRAAFCDHQDRRRLLGEAEAEVVKVLTEAAR